MIQQNFPLRANEHVHYGIASLPAVLVWRTDGPAIIFFFLIVFPYENLSSCTMVQQNFPYESK